MRRVIAVYNFVTILKPIKTMKNKLTTFDAALIGVIMGDAVVNTIIRDTDECTGDVWPVVAEWADEYINSPEYDLNDTFDGAITYAENKARLVYGVSFTV